MWTLSDQELLACFRDAIELDLDEDFVQMLIDEIKKRQLDLHMKQTLTCSKVMPSFSEAELAIRFG